jgi:hypothetical protein
MALRTIALAVGVCVALPLSGLGGTHAAPPQPVPTAAMTAEANQSGLYLRMPVEALARKHRVDYYRVKANDSLTGIAHHYGMKWTHLWCANKKVIGKTTTLYRGERLRIESINCHVPTSVISPPVQIPPSPVGPPDALPPSNSGGFTGHIGCAQLEQLWVNAGGPSSAEFVAAEIAMAESGGNQYATEPVSGAAGYWQILGQVVPGNIYDPMVNAENAVKKYNDAGGFSPWVTYTDGSYAGLC